MYHSKCQKKIPIDLYDIRSIIRLTRLLTPKVLRLQFPLGINGTIDTFVVFFTFHVIFTSQIVLQAVVLFSADSDAVWQGEVVLLSVSDQRTAVDLAPDPLLYHLPPVELQARVHCVHTHGGKVRKILSNGEDIKDSKIRAPSWLPKFPLRKIMSFM